MFLIPFHISVQFLSRIYNETSLAITKKVMFFNSSNILTRARDTATGYEDAFWRMLSTRAWRDRSVAGVRVKFFIFWQIPELVFSFSLTVKTRRSRKIHPQVYLIKYKYDISTYDTKKIIMKGWTKLLAHNRSGNNEGKYMLQAENYINKSLHKNSDSNKRRTF